jgi:ABC-type dipeptide/oligopeptide/nickel transport system ATPase component
MEVNHLSVSFPAYGGQIQAVDDVSFQIREGETFALVGESGCGKSVTAKAIMGLLGNTSAKVGASSEILFQGKDLTKLTKGQLNKIRGNEISIVFQDAMAALNPTMTIGKQVGEVIRLHEKVRKSVAYEKTAEMLSLVELPNVKELMKYYPHQLSGGMRQRVMIAMALSCNPRLLIADEPTTALDVTIQAQILELLEKMKEKFHMSILLITHDLGVVAGVADTVHVMYQGKILEEGTTCELFSNPRHPYTISLLEASRKRQINKKGDKEK